MAKTIKGMYQDTRDIDIPPGYAKFLKNVLLTNTRGAAENEPGFEVHVQSGLDYPVIGVHVIQESKILFVTNNNTCDDLGYSGILEVTEDGTVRNIIDSNRISGLNFCLQHPIQAEHYINFRGERVIAFIDDLNIPRIVNIDAADDVDDVNDLRLFPLSNLANLTTEVSDTGGALETGAYFLFYRYENPDGTFTNWFFGDGPVYINDERTGVGFVNHDGAEAGTTTNKSIRVSFSSTDTSYSQVTLAVIKVIGGVVSAEEIKTVTRSNTFQTSYTGLENSTELTIDEIIVQSPNYINAKAITQLNNRLFLGNLQTADLLDYQALANNIRINYTYQKINATSLTDPSHKLNARKGFRPGEVYAFYIAFHLKDGTWSRAFHIPGRPPAPVAFGGATEVTNNIIAYDAPSNQGFPQSGDCTGSGLTQCYPDDQWTFILVDGDITNFYSKGDYISVDGSPTCYFRGSNIVGYIDPPGGAQTGILINQPYLPGYDFSCTGITYISTTVFAGTTLETDASQLAIDRGLHPGPITEPDVPKIFQVVNTSNNPNALTNMGYWENETEQYPLGFPGLGPTAPNAGDGKNVRHHKFPTLRRLYEIVEIEQGSSQRTGTQDHYILGINVDNVQIPASIANNVQGFRIFYADKNTTNSQVIAYDSYQPLGELDGSNLPASGPGSTGDLVPTGGFWDLAGDGTSFGAYTRPVYNKCLGSSTDLLYDKPAVSPLFIEFHYQVSKDGLNDFYTNFNSNGGTVSQTGRSDPDTQQIGFSVVNFANGIKRKILSTDSIYGITDPLRYIPGNILDTEFTNRYSDEVIYYGLDSSVLSDTELLGTPKAANRVNTPSGSIRPNWWEGSLDGAVRTDEAYAWIISYNTIIADIHTSFDNQNLAMTDVSKLGITGAGTYDLLDIYGGDDFISFESRLRATPGPNGFKETDWNDGDIGLRNWVGITLHTRNNWNFRHERTDNIYSWYWPKRDVSEFMLPAPDTPNAVFLWGADFTRYNDTQYNTDYSINNDLIALNIYSPQEEFATGFPNLIIRSAAQSPDSTLISWRSFLVNDRYTTDTSKGAVWNLQGVANEHLLIHQIDSLFITRDRTTIKGDVTGATLGAGDIFDLTPKEIVTSDKGHAGTQHRFSCKLTKAGYTFFDLKQGKWFLLQGISDLQEISLNGFRNHFRDRVAKTIQDNPFYETGITIDYDEKYNRLIAGFINGAQSFSISYAPELKAYASFHDYKPNVIFTTRSNRVFSVNNGFDANLAPDNLYFGLYEHNVGVPGIYYNLREPEPVPFPMILDLVFNQDNYQRKVIQTIEWTSEVFDDDLSEFYRDETFDYVTVRNKTKATGRIELERLVNLTRMHNSNTRRNESVWSFNAIRDISRNTQPVDQGFLNDYTLNPSIVADAVAWYNRGRFLDQYCIYRLEYSNLSARRILLLDHLVNFRPSFR